MAYALSPSATSALGRNSPSTRRRSTRKSAETLTRNEEEWGEDVNPSNDAEE